MGRFWRVDKALEDSEGLRWIRERLEVYDWSKADWVSVRRGQSEKYAFRGVCKTPRNGCGYRINCNVSEHAAYPIYQDMRVSPLYRNPDGTWPEVPEGHLVGDCYVAARSNGKAVQWKRLYRPQELRSEDEVLVFLVAHEAFHYLRKTRQVEGRHGEITADAFALKLLEQHRDGSHSLRHGYTRSSVRLTRTRGIDLSQMMCISRSAPQQDPLRQISRERGGGKGPRFPYKQEG